LRSYHWLSLKLPKKNKKSLAYPGPALYGCFSVLLYRVFGRFSVRGQKRHYFFRKSKNDLALVLFLPLPPPTHHGDHRFFLGGPLALGPWPLGVGRRSKTRCIYAYLQGAGKKKCRGPPWWVGGSEYEKGLGSDLFFLDICFIVFLNSPHRETPKNVIKKKSRTSRFWVFGRFFCKNFSTRFFWYTFFVVFLNSHR
jgi:hypothetical protein